MTGHRGHITARLALALAGAGLVASGVTLMLRALWLVLASALGPIWASAVLGGALVLIGALVVALATRVNRRQTDPGRDLLEQILSAFFDGLRAGRSVRDR